MGIEHQQRAVVAHQRGEGAGLGGAQQQVVAVQIDAVGGVARTGLRAIGVGAWHQNDVDALQQRRQWPAQQFLGHDQQGLAARRLVAVLLAYQQHGGALAFCQAVGICAGCAREHQGVDGFCALRGAQRQQGRLRARWQGASGQVAQPLGQFSVGGEGRALRCQARCVVTHRRIGKTGGDGGVVQHVAQRCGLSGRQGW